LDPGLHLFLIVRPSAPELDLITPPCIDGISAWRSPLFPTPIFDLFWRDPAQFLIPLTAKPSLTDDPDKAK
jgi:hypothetical protein